MTALRNMTDWRSHGFVPKESESPTAIVSTYSLEFRGRYYHKMFARTQVRPLRAYVRTPARIFAKTADNVALATQIVNRSAKRYRDAATCCYSWGAFSLATVGRLHKESLYRLKDVGVRWLIDAGRLTCAARHGQMYLWGDGRFSFHSAVRPAVEPAVREAAPVWVEARMPEKTGMRLKDAVALLECLGAGGTVADFDSEGVGQ